MPFYQNVFESDFTQNILTEDLKFALNFKVPANTNRSSYMGAWADPPYNTVGNTTLTINYSIDAGKSYNLFTVSLTSGTSRTSDQIVADLNNNSSFSSMFLAKAVPNSQGVNRVLIQATVQREMFKAYISNSSAETVLRFNARAGVAELPSYCDRHTFSNYKDHGPYGDNTYPDSQGCLIKLTIPTDNWYITNAGFTATAQKDWQLLRGRSTVFKFKNYTLDGSNRITGIVEYPAGAKAGDWVKKTEYIYSGGNSSSQPNYIFECPYVLASGDLSTLPSIST